MDAKLRDEKARRPSAVGRKDNAEATRRPRVHNRRRRAVPAPEANAELQVNLERMRLMTRINVTSKSEKFPPPHQDGAVGIPLNDSYKGPSSFTAFDASFASSIFESMEDSRNTLTGLPDAIVNAGKGAARRTSKEGTQKLATSLALRRLMELNRSSKVVVHRTRGKELEVFGSVK
ncbi:hypothetical protein GW17_00025597 [Ensete ventricosum]|nr:hypothetical protein GW17_00025597 [Ensete ventricosum]